MASMRHTEVSVDVNCPFFSLNSPLAVSDSQATSY